MAADLVGTGGQTHLIISEHYNFKKSSQKGFWKVLRSSFDVGIKSGRILTLCRSPPQGQRCSCPATPRARWRWTQHDPSARS